MSLLKWALIFLVVSIIAPLALEALRLRVPISPASSFTSL